ncbi:hypothetical protein ACEPAI_738 [Sanghuangporus weigelae]
MPKVPSETFHNHSGVTQPASAPILRRNQVSASRSAFAAHVTNADGGSFDARRPCSTCVRSHRNTVSHAPPGVEVPLLECTFDEPTENGVQQHAAPKNKYERLENRISELEALLRQKDEESNRSRSSISPPGSSSSAVPSNSGRLTYNNLPSISTVATLNHGLPYAQPPQPFSPIIPAHISPVNTPPLNFSSGSAGDSKSATNHTTQVLWPNWPHDLPSFDLLQHLVEVFLAFQPHAGRLFHGPTFLASLSLPATHANFPHIAILHAISAVGSLYTPAVPPAPLPNFAETPADDLFQSAYKRRKALPDSFGEVHAKFAMAAVEESTSLGERLFECQQATTILTWFYHAHAKWADMFLTTGRAMRYLVPLGLNMCPPFHSISKSLRAPSIIAPARTVIEDEMRRNTFWLTYATERLYSSGNGWAMSLDDEDISQLLPVRGEEFDQGILVPPKGRQWAHVPNMLLNHPPEQTDSFVLYIKSSILMSRVKNFNLRFRSKHFAGDPDMIPPAGTSNKEQSATAQYIDPRDTPGFIKTDHLVSAFIPSFPKGLRSATRDGVVDIHLLLAFLAPNVAKILLHEPHIDLQRRGCISVQRTLEAARAILDQLYAIWSTSFDLTLLENFCCFAFFMAGRVLTHVMRQAKESGDQIQGQAIRTELEYIRIALVKIGMRLPLAYRYAKMLDDIIFQNVGILEDVILPNFQNPSFPTSPEFAMQTIAQDSLDFLMGVGAPPLNFD